MIEPEISKMLVLSTAHVDMPTRSLLDEWCRGIDLVTRQGISVAPTLVGAHDYGWLIYCTETCEGLPDDLTACIEYARGLGCCYLLLDADADEVDGLTVYESETTE